MGTKIILLLVTFGLTHGLDGDTNYSSTDAPVVKVTQGLLRGEVLDLVTGDGTYYSFKGIPYAAPPLGKLRFKAPQPPLSWDGIRNATSHGAECIQSFMSNDICAGAMNLDEDCLFLNVYTTDLAENTSLPVMVFIHGGGYEHGSGNVGNYGPDFLLNHGVVVVTMNYRLGALGFLCLDTEDVPGNAGFKDQVAALKWVKENIKSFGGDPDQVTLFGNSAGSAAVSYHLLSPMSKGLFVRVICSSGVAICDWNLSHQPVRRAFMLGRLLGNETDNPNELIDFLRSVPAEQLVDVETTIFASEKNTRNVFKMYFFPPVVEKYFGSDGFLTESPSEILKQGNINGADVFIGHTNYEALAMLDVAANIYAQSYDRYPELLVPTGILINTTQNTTIEAADTIRQYYFGRKRIDVFAIAEFTRYLTDSMFLYSIHEFASRLARIENIKVFFYLFTCTSDRNIYGASALKYNLTGAAHSDDTAYLFDYKECNMTIDTSSREFELIQLVNTVYTNFAKYGNPSPDSSLNVTWPEFNNSSRQYVEIGDELTIRESYKPEMLDFWRRIYETAGISL